jgi:hypothetical protein
MPGRGVAGETVSSRGWLKLPGGFAYSVTQEVQTLQQKVHWGGIPKSAVPMAQQELQTIGTPKIDVYFESSSLLRKLAVTLGGAATSVSVSLQMRSDACGITVNVEPPASSDVISYVQFVQDARASLCVAPVSLPAAVPGGGVAAHIDLEELWFQGMPQ